MRKEKKLKFSTTQTILLSFLGVILIGSILLSLPISSATGERVPYLDALEADHDYLTAGGVFPEELLANFIKNKRAECSELSKIPHPAEFDRYYNL